MSTREQEKEFLAGFERGAGGGGACATWGAKRRVHPSPGDPLRR